MSGSTIDPAVTRTIHQPIAPRTAQAESTPARKSAGISGVQTPPPAAKPQAASSPVPAGVSEAETAVTEFLDHHYGLNKEFAKIDKDNQAKPGKSAAAPLEAEKKREAVSTRDAELKDKALALASKEVTLAKLEYHRLYENRAPHDKLTEAGDRLAHAEELVKKLTPEGIAVDAEQRLTKAFTAAGKAEQSHINWLKSEHDPKTPITNAGINRNHNQATDAANDAIDYARRYRDQQKAAAAAAASGETSKP